MNILPLVSQKLPMGPFHLKKLYPFLRRWTFRAELMSDRCCREQIIVHRKDRSNEFGA